MLEDLGFTSGAPASSNNSDPAPASAPGLVKRSKGEEGMAKSVAYSPTEIAGGMPQRDAEYEARYAAAPGAREDLIREINRAPNEAARATLEGEFSKVYGEAPPVAGLMRVSTAARAAQPRGDGAGGVGVKLHGDPLGGVRRGAHDATRLPSSAPSTSTRWGRVAVSVCMPPSRLALSTPCDTRTRWAR